MIASTAATHDLSPGEKRVLLKRRLRGRKATPRPSARHPLSHGQRSLWFLHSLAPDSAAYHVVMACRIRSAVDVSLLRSTFQRLVDRHPVLRTTYPTSPDGEPVQVVHQRRQVHFEIDDDARGEQDLVETLWQEGFRPFDLERGPVLRARIYLGFAEGPVLLVAMHHIATDGWSGGILLEELGLLYTAARRGEPAALPPLRVRPTDYVHRQRAMLAGPRGERLRDYWRNRLQGADFVLELPADRPRPPVQSFRGAREYASLDPELSGQLRTLAQSWGATLNTVLLAAFQVLLHRLTGREDLLVGSPTAGREDAELTRVMGYFVNPIVLRADLHGEPTFAAFLATTRRRVLTDFEHGSYPFSLLVKLLVGDRDPSRFPLFQVSFVLDRAAGRGQWNLLETIVGMVDSRVELGGLILKPIPLPERTSQLDLDLTMTEVDGRLAAAAQYDTELFDGTTIRRLLAHYRILLAGIVADPEGKISCLPLLPAAERHQLVVEWNDVRGGPATGDCLGELLEARVRLDPEAVAVIDGDVELTFGELNAWANRRARRLRELGLGPEKAAGVFMERTVAAVVDLFAVLKAGGVYLPLDSDLPAARLTAMVEDAGAEILVGRPPAAEILAGRLLLRPAAEGERIDRYDDADLGLDLSPSQLAYVIYTSGSTGVPKGVGVSHGAAGRHLAAVGRIWELGTEDRMLHSASWSFDVSLEDLFVPLCRGAAVVLAPAGLPDPEDLLACGRRHGVTAMDLSPAFCGELLRTVEDRGAAACGRLRLLVVGGDVMPPELVRRWRRLAPDVRVVNAYGPTEAVITATVHEASADSPHRVPIGRAVGARSLTVPDRGGRPAALGVPGELWIGGPLVARGYLDRPALTAGRFIPDPLAPPPGGARLYRTGDLARHLPDGRLEVLGRLDHQVKIRGFRIELGEIEAVLRTHPAVREAVALVRRDGDHPDRLVAYVTARESAPPPDPAALRAHLAARLPAWMVPSALVRLASFPRLPGGGPDHRALPAPEAERDAASTPPRGELERQIAALWCELLGTETVDVNDNFFEAGGHSLLIVRLRHRLQEILDRDVPVVELYRHPTVRALVGYLDSTATASARTAEPPPIEVDEEDGEVYPLSSVQEWFWSHRGAAVPSTVFVLLRFSGALHVAVLRRSLEAIVERHEPLRTTFAEAPEGAVQRIAPESRCELPLVDLGMLAAAHSEATVVRIAVSLGRAPIDLERGPILRTFLFRRSAREHLLFILSHHIAIDGWSGAVFIREITMIYRSLLDRQPPPLPPLPIRYRHFARWQRRWCQGEKQTAWWREQLRGVVGSPRFTAPGAVPPTPSFQAAKGIMTLPGDLSRHLRELGSRRGGTLFPILLAAFKTLLHAVTGERDVTVASIYFNRDRHGTGELIGSFATFLPLRSRLAASDKFSELLERVRKTLVEAVSRSHVSIEKVLAEAAAAPGEPNGLPFFRVMFSLQNHPRADLDELPGLKTEVVPVDTGLIKHDLIVMFDDDETELRARWRFNVDLFDAATRSAMIRRYQRLLERVVEDPERPIAELVAAT